MHRFRFVPELNLVLMDFGEQIDDAGLLSQLITVYDHPEFVPGMDEINSFLRTRTVDVTGNGLRSIAQSFPRPGHEHAAPNLVAVVSGSKLGHGLTRLYAAYAEQSKRVTMESFSSLAEAADWIDAGRGREPGTAAVAVELAGG